MGNNRMVVNKNGMKEQITHYYPYGGVIGDISTLLSDVTKGNNENVQKYKLFHYIPREQARSEGKELDRTFGLDNYESMHASTLPWLQCGTNLTAKPKIITQLARMLIVGETR